MLLLNNFVFYLINLKNFSTLKIFDFEIFSLQKKLLSFLQFQHVSVQWPSGTAILAFFFKISSSKEKYFQVLCSNTCNQPYFRFALNSLCKNQARFMKNLGKKGLFGEHFFQKSKREITVSSNNRIFCILKKISFF